MASSRPPVHFIPVRSITRFFAVLLTCLVPCLSHAQLGRTKAYLLLDSDTARPGDTITAGLRLEMPDGWHTYWRNSGASGIPTRIVWQFPPGLTNGDILWPLPTKTDEGEFTTYIYDHEVILLIPIKLSADLKPGPLELKAHVSWLECKEVCVPGKADVSATLTISDTAKPSADADAVAAWKTKVPQTNAMAFTAQWEKPTSDSTRPLVIAYGTGVAAKNMSFDSVDFYPNASDSFEVQPATQVISAYSADIRLRKTVKKFSGDWPKEISGVLIETIGGQRYGSEIKVPITDSTNASVATPIAKKLPLMLLYAFIGGLILNIMPCVFPVIALKILGFVQQSRNAPQHIFHHGLVYAFGVVISFLILAGAVIILQHAGSTTTWGMQLQNRSFTLILTLVTLLVALNLFGVFEVTLGGNVLTAADKLASGSGFGGTFFNGMLATFLATSCTAPYVAGAVGFAFTQPPAIIVLMFVTVALGLAFPYIILSWQPAWLKFLPRPGAWMEKFKMAMGFPMLATTVWLFSFNAKRFGTGGPLRVGLFLVATAMAVWIWGQFVQRGRKGKLAAALCSLALFAATGAYALSTEAAAWQPWSPEAVEKARAEGHPVLVDFTADWCINCKVNKAEAIDVAPVQAKLKDLGVITLIGDDTDESPAIAAELKKFERAGVPLVLIYPKDRARQPIVLPPLLTPGIVQAALDEAGK